MRLLSYKQSKFLSDKYFDPTRMRNRSAVSIKNPSTRFSRLIFLFYSLLQLWNQPLSKHIEKRERKFYRIFLIETSNYFEKKKKEGKIKIRERIKKETEENSFGNPPRPGNFNFHFLRLGGQNLIAAYLHFNFSAAN